MKKYLKLLFAAFVATISFSLVSCTGDDEPKDSGDSHGSGCQNANKAIIKFDGDFLTSITEGSRVQNITYDNEGRISEISRIYGGREYSLFKFDYNNCSFTSEDPDADYDKGSISFNEDGYISKITCYDNGEDDYGIWDCELNMTFAYNASGHLSELSFTEEIIYQDDEENGESVESYTSVCKFHWENGNLVRINETQTDKEDGKTIRKFTEEYVFTYSNLQNTFNQFPFCIYDEITNNWWGDAEKIFAFIGLMGKGTVNLPEEMNSHTSNDYTYHDKYQYKLNSNGSIAWENGITFGYGNSSSKSLAPVYDKSTAKDLKHRSKLRERRKSHHKKNLK